MEFNFELVEKSVHKSSVPEGVLRLGAKNFTLAPDVANRLHGTRVKLPEAPIGTIKLQFALDVDHNAIKISTSPEGFACSFYESGTIVGRIPAALKAKATIGDYKVVDEQSTVFVLAQ